jgi:hypothetical protein
MSIRFAVVLLLTCSAAAFPADTIEAFGFKWAVPFAADWKLENEAGAPVLKLLVKRPQEHPRRPIQFALAGTPDWARVTVEAEVKRDGSSLIIVYAFRDEAHFNYVHLSSDTPSEKDMHNGIFHVWGGDRVRISSTRGPGSLPSQDWTSVRLTYDSATGRVHVTVNGQSFPSLEGVDLSLGAGKVGIGSFFETAQFRKVRITGVAAK